MADNQSGAAYGGNFKSQRRTTKVDFFRRWFPIREVSTVDPYPHTLELPIGNEAWTADFKIVTLQGANEVEVVVSHSALDASGRIPDIKNWGGELWLFGGEDTRYGGPDQRRWARVARAEFSNMKNHTFCERFDVGGYLFTMFRVSQFVGGGNLHLLMRAT